MWTCWACQLLQGRRYSNPGMNQTLAQRRISFAKVRTFKLFSFFQNLFSFVFQNLSPPTKNKMKKFFCCFSSASSVSFFSKSTKFWLSREGLRRKAEKLRQIKIISISKLIFLITLNESLGSDLETEWKWCGYESIYFLTNLLQAKALFLYQFGKRLI